MGQPLFTATRLNQQWTIDFVHDRMATVEPRVRSSIDTLTGVSRLRSRHLLAEPTGSRERLMVQSPKAVDRSGSRMGNGSELTSRHFPGWGNDQRMELVHMQPGKPVQNAYVESFDILLRDECLNTQWFRNLWDAGQQVSTWRLEFN